MGIPPDWAGHAPQTALPAAKLFAGHGHHLDVEADSTSAG